MGALCSQPLPNLFAQPDCGLASPHAPRPPPTRPRPHLEASSKGGRMKGLVLHLLRSTRRGSTCLGRNWPNPGLPPAHLPRALPTWMSRGFHPHWSADISLSRTHTCAHTHTLSGGVEVQVNGGAPKGENDSLPTCTSPQASRSGVLVKCEPLEPGCPCSSPAPPVLAV